MRSRRLGAGTSPGWAVVAVAAVVLVSAGGAWGRCSVDCDLDEGVSVEEIVRGVSGVEGCAAADADGDGEVSAQDLRRGVEAALAGCPDQLAFVVATDFETGSFATVGLDEPRPLAPSHPSRRVHSDAVARSYRGLVYSINRFFGDNIQVLDPADGFRTVWQCSTGAGSNPHDIAFVGPTKAYVTRNDTAQLWIVDPSAPPRCAGFKTGEIDLSAYADDDGVPEMSQMAIVGERLYVLLQYLDRDAIFAPAGVGRIAVIDTARDEVVDLIPLSGENPFAQTKGLTVQGGDLLVASAGRYTVDDGGIERVDLGGGGAQGYFVSEGDLGGDITDFVLVSERLGYAVLSKADFSNSLVAFDPLERRVTATLVSGSTLVADIEVNTRGELFAADRTFDAPGLRVFRAADGEALGPKLDTGLPPFDILFLK